MFAKWRSPLVIDEANGQPSDFVIEANMADLARYALICQDVGLVPIVEPDVSMAGTHTLEAAVAINTKIQAALYKHMLEHGVFMEVRSQWHCGSHLGYARTSLLQAGLCRLNARLPPTTTCCGLSLQRPDCGDVVDDLLKYNCC